ncbi:MAG: CRISPR-associated RAMP protein [Acetobacteraceae bacterium]|nr:CRISPR-associated RAMP protein [Acetobacteraceae bacterium]
MTEMGVFLKVRIRGAVEALSPLHVGAPSSTSPLERDNPVVKDGLGRPYIPGSSLKGALRSRVESILRGLGGPNAACDVLDTGCVDKRTAEEFTRNPAATLPKLIGQLCPVCRAFGSPWFASPLRFGDLYPEGPVRLETRTGVAIDRDRLTAASRRLFTLEVVPVGTTFRLDIRGERVDGQSLGLLWLALREFESDGFLGGGRSRGLGRVRIKDLNCEGLRNLTDLRLNLVDPAYWPQVAAEDLDQLAYNGLGPEEGEGRV